MSTLPDCVNCGVTAVQSIRTWLAHCPDCALESSRLAEVRSHGDELIGWDEASARAMQHLRRENARLCFATLRKHIDLVDKSLLDVGWFLDEAQHCGLRTHGLEIDPAMALEARSRGHSVDVNRFPGVSPPSTR